jgi:LmbE family N-acetylglucosaminyl deacetylase
MSTKRFIHKIHDTLITQRMRLYEADRLGQTSMVFSPHQDDETLGCGGTILRKKQAGAELQIVFMTDGCSSHAHLMLETELRAIRMQEAIAAAQMLGVEQENVLFLGFKDGTLHQQRERAIEKVSNLLQGYRPQEIFIPYYREAPSDHSVTTWIVLSALKAHPLNVTIYEYPIWFWRHFPIISLTGNLRENLSVLKNSVISANFGLNLLTDFQCAMYIEDLLEIKRAALEKHRSQMQRLLSTPAWQTLEDVSRGEFLECFFQRYEIFRRYIVSQ